MKLISGKFETRNKLPTTVWLRTNGDPSWSSSLRQWWLNCALVDLGQLPSTSLIARHPSFEVWGH